MEKPKESYVAVNQDGRPTAFVGPDAVNLFRAKTLASALRMYAKTGMLPTRGVSPTKMLQLARQYTGKEYRRGQHMLAANDIQVWIDTMTAALPVVEEKGASK